MKSGHPVLYCLPFQNHLLVTKKGAVKEKAGWWLAPKFTAKPSGAASLIPMDPCIILKNLPAATFIYFQSAGSWCPQGSHRPCALREAEPRVGGGRFPSG